MKLISPKHIALFALAAGALAAPGLARAQTTIDPFTSGTFTFTAPAGGSDGGDQTVANVPGGDRTVTVYNPYSTPPFVASLPMGGAGVTVGPGYGLFGLSYGTRYNGNATTVGYPFTSAHLNLSNADSLRFTFTTLTGSVRIYATLQSFSGGYLSNGNQGDPAFVVSAPGTYDLPFSSLRGGINLSNIDSLSLNFQPYNGVTFTLANLAAAPEPSAWAAFAVAGLGLGALRLRTRKRPA